MVGREVRILGLALVVTFGTAPASRTAHAEEPETPTPAAGGAHPGDDDDEAVPPSLDERTKKAVELGVRWLRGRGTTEGWWGNCYNPGGKTYDGGSNVYQNPLGATALALYTLMKCGVPPSDPVVKRGFAWLQKHEKNGGNSYELSMKLLAVTATADPFKKTKDATAAGEKVRLTGPMRAWAEGLLSALVAMRAPDGWRYWGKADSNKGGKQDLSSTQLAALAIFSAQRCGLKVDPAIWTGILRFTLDQQEEDGPARPRAVVDRPRKDAKAGRPAPKPGDTVAPAPAPADASDMPDKARGFAYIRRTGPDPEDRAASGGMTACGVASVMMARFALMTRAEKEWAKQDAARVQASVHDGLAWLDGNWSPYKNPPNGASRWHVYYLYCVERAMDLVGGWRLGKRFWYVEMAEQLLPLQQKAGFWDSGSAKKEGGDVVDTCFALLFLQRATRGGIPFPSVTGGADEPSVDNR